MIGVVVAIIAFNFNGVIRNKGTDRIFVLSGRNEVDSEGSLETDDTVSVQSNVSESGVATQSLQTADDIDTSKWDLSKVDIVYDKTGIPVPVPKGFTASSVESEMYVNGLNEVHTGTKTELELSSTGDYPWTKMENGAWKSGNIGVANSTSTLSSNEFEIQDDGGALSLNWSASSNGCYAYLYAVITNVDTNEEIRSPNLGGSSLGSTVSILKYVTYEKILQPGKYKVDIMYTKLENGASNTADAGCVKSASIINFDESGQSQLIEHKYGGFVIYSGSESVTDENKDDAQKNRNQWVWIPVTDVSKLYKTNSNGRIQSRLYIYTANGRYENSYSYEPGLVSDYDIERNYMREHLQGYNSQKFLQEMQTQLKETIDSISKYGGFWIGRYETGDISKSKPVIRKMNTDISYQTWYDMYTKLKRIETTENTKTSMIWGCLWDETLQWLVDSGRLDQYELLISTGFGNYYDTTFEYTMTNGNTSTKQFRRLTKIPAGSSEYTNTNNIYDMAGNIFYWTLESTGTMSRRIRGGDTSDYGVNESISYRSGYSPNTRYSVGFRAYMYIK